MRGRRPKPSAMKIRDGSRQPRNDQEPNPEPGLPKPPAHLDKEARKAWREIGGELLATNVMTTMDGPALALLSVAYGRWTDAEKNLAKLGHVVKSPSGFPVQNPYLSIANKAWEQVSKILIEFGMTPSSRTRVKTTGRLSSTDGKAKFFHPKIAG